MMGSDTAPAAVKFLEPHTARDEPSRSPDSYRHAIADCLVMAARKTPPMIETQFRNRGGRLVSMKELSCALQFVSLLESDQRRAWIAVEPCGDMAGLVPELNACIDCLRRLSARAELQRNADENLAVLAGSILVHGTEPSPPDG